MPSLRFIIHCDMSVSLFGFPTKKNDRLHMGRGYDTAYTFRFLVASVLQEHIHDKKVSFSCLPVLKTGLRNMSAFNLYISFIVPVCGNIPTSWNLCYRILIQPIIPHPYRTATIVSTNNPPANISDAMITLLWDFLSIFPVS